MPDGERSPTLSVVVAVLDEARCIAARLAQLRSLAGVDEVVVVDGGSTDDTARLTRQASVGPGARVVLLDGPRGRGAQLGHGARHAAGALLLFVHADCALPADAPAVVRRVLARPGVVAGAFRTRHVWDGPHRRWIRPLLPVADLRSRYTRLPYGDQALFVRADAYRRAGGFHRMAMFEDVDLARRLWRLGRVEVVDDAVEVSARRYAARPVRAVVAMNAFPVLWRLGLVSDVTLARWYGRPR